MSKFMEELDSSIQAKLDSDTDFQSSLEGLSDDDKIQKIQEEKTSRIEAELESIKTQASESKKNKELADNYKIRAEKAERTHKEPKGGEGTPQNPSTDTLSAKDAMLLAKADVDLEDVDEVISFANFKKITIKEALENKTLKSLLAENKEHRASAIAAQTKGSPRTGTKDTFSSLEQKALKGELPEEDIDKLTEGLMAQKLASVKKR